MRYRKVHDHTWRRLQRDEALVEQGGRCAYCRKAVARDDATSDHVKPRSTGGIDRENIVAACMACNSAKGAMSATTFINLLKRSQDLTLSFDGPLGFNRIFLIKQQAAVRRINLDVERAEKRIGRFAAELAGRRPAKAGRRAKTD